MRRIRGRQTRRVRMVGKLPGRRTSRMRRPRRDRHPRQGRVLHAQPLGRIRQPQGPALRDRKGRANRPSATILREERTYNVEPIA
jgi:hypothetical protein